MRLILLIIIGIAFIGCNILKQKSRKVENWKIDFFGSTFLNKDVESIYFYNVRMQHIEKKSEVLISDKDKNLFLQGLDSLEYIGLTISRNEYAVKIILPDTSYLLWGTTSYIGPYKTSLTYSTPNKFDIMDYYFKKYME